MELNKEKFIKDILEKIFNNNQRKCALELDLTPPHLNRILKNKCSAGAKFFGKLKVFCNGKNLNFDKYIFLK